MEVLGATASYRTGLEATASNPLTIVSWAAIFGAAAPASLLDSTAAAVSLIVGVMIGSAAWFVVIAWAASRLGARLGQRALWGIDVTAGVGLLGFGTLLGLRTVHDA